MVDSDATHSLGDLPPSLDRYELVEVLREGAEGRVVKAWDESLNRHVSLALFESYGEQEEQEDSLFYFHRQARALASLNHPNIVNIYAYSGKQSPLPYLASELIDGPCLDDYFDDMPHGLPPEVVLAVASELGRALQHIHTQKIVHREIKPESIYLAEEGRLVLGEFGIAKSYGDPQQLGKTLVRDDTALLGSPAFMAPEQLADQPASPASDLFSTGATLYALSTGSPPFVGENMSDILEALTEVRFPQPRQLRPDLPADLESLLLSMLVKAPEGRIPSGKHLSRQARGLLAGKDPRDILERFLDGEYPTPGPPSTEAVTARLSPKRGPARADSTAPGTPLLPHPADQSTPTPQPAPAGGETTQVDRPPAPVTDSFAAPAPTTQLGRQTSTTYWVIGVLVALMLGLAIGFVARWQFASSPADASGTPAPVQLTIHTAVPGQLLVDGRPHSTLIAGDKRISLSPGTHTLQLRPASGAPLAAVRIMLLAGTSPRFELK